MKVAKVSDLQNLADGTVIGEMRLQVKQVFKANTGEGKYGPWRVQPCILKDVTGEVRASFWTDDDILGLTGKFVNIKSNPGPKGLSGLSVKLSKHSGQNELSISDKASWPTDEDLGGTASYVAAVSSSLPSNPAHDKLSKDPTAALNRIKQSAKLYEACLVQARDIANANDLSAEHMQALCASLYISSDRAGLHACFPIEEKKVETQEVDDLLTEAGW
jgi:hypothetical protein